jgi:hypothetical protein
VLAPLAGSARSSPPGSARLVAFGLAIGVALLFMIGVVWAFGPVGWLMLLLTGATGWLVLGHPGVAFDGTGAPAPPTEAPLTEQVSTEPLPVPATAPSLTTAELCWAWRVSYVRLGRASCDTELDHVAELRASYLDELWRRDPAAFHRWLPSARAAGDPARFFCRRPTVPPPHDRGLSATDT